MFARGCVVCSTQQMRMNRGLKGLLLVLVLALSSACKTKAPAPAEADRGDAINAQGESAPSGTRSLGLPKVEYEREYGVGPHDPHGPAGHLNPPPSHASGDIKHVDVGGLTFQMPEGWEYEHPSSAMRRAQLGVRTDTGTAGLVVYFFGNQGAGSAQANIDRWVGQFKNPDGTMVSGVEPVTRKVANFDVTEIEVAGTYVGGMGSGETDGGQPGQRMVAAIVSTKAGPYYFKLVGDDAVVKSNRGAFEALLASMKPSDG